MGKLLSQWIDELNRKRILVTQRSIATNARKSFDEGQKRKWKRDVHLLAKDDFARFKQSSQMNFIKTIGVAANCRY